MFKLAKFIISALLAAGAPAALASDVPQSVADSMMKSCRADYHRICSDVVPGSGRASRCLLDHETELSPACLQAVKTAHAIEVCSPDYRNYCDGRDGSQAMQCLAGRMGALQPECRRIVAANAPYMSQQPQRYVNDRAGPYGWRGLGPYSYRGGSEDEDRDADEGEASGPNGPYGAYPSPYRYPGQPGAQGVYPYSGRQAFGGAYPYPGRPGPDGAYAYGRPAPEGTYPDAVRPAEPGERYAGEDQRRFRSYDERYSGRNIPQPNSDSVPGAREAPDEDRE
jgi:hypothetical protein